MAIFPKRSTSDELTNSLATVLAPGSVASEAYRRLRTNLLYGFVDNPAGVIVLTSAAPGEGKSTTCANLGVVLAQAGKRTLILDCDFRKPALHKFFGMRNLYGVADVLIEQSSLQEVCSEPVEGLKVACSGPIPPNPSEILGSQRFSTFLAGVREEFDYVLVDAPPIGLVSDPAIIAIQADGVLLTIDTQNTRKGSVRQAVRHLEAVGANILGTVMTRVKVSNSKYSYGYTYKEY